MSSYRMSLESLLKPLQWADEHVLKYYTKKTEEWEEKGRSKYSLAQICNAGAVLANTLYLTLQGYYAAGVPLLGTQSLEVMRNITEPRYNPDAVGGEKADLPVTLKAAQAIANYARFPLFISGAALLAKGIADLMTFAATKESQPLADAVENLSLGYAMLGTASSMYIKNSNPKLLKKNPAKELTFFRELVPVKIKRRR